MKYKIYRYLYNIVGTLYKWLDHKKRIELSKLK